MGKYDGFRAEMARMKKLIQASDAIKFVNQEATSHAVPSKRRTKGKKASPAWHLASTRGVPGGDGKSGWSRMKMVQATYTGTRVVQEETKQGRALMGRLENSARNSNTTSTQSDGITRGLIQ